MLSFAAGVQLHGDDRAHAGLVDRHPGIKILNLFRSNLEQAIVGIGWAAREEKARCGMKIKVHPYK